MGQIITQLQQIRNLRSIALIAGGAYVSDGTPNGWSMLKALTADSGGNVSNITWHGTIITPTYGGTGANLSATGGNDGQVPPGLKYLKQGSVGGNVTVDYINGADLPLFQSYSSPSKGAIIGPGGPVPGGTEIRFLRADGAWSNSVISDLQAPTADVSWGGFKLTSLGTPASSTDGATKGYVDGLIAGGTQFKPTATVATTAALAANTYANGTLGVGATLTANANGALTVDTHAVVAGESVVVKNEVTTSHNGLYAITQAGDGSHPYILTRATGMDQSTEFSGAFIPVGNVGSGNANTLWLANPVGTVTVGTTSIPFTQLNGATDLIAGTGITISGNTLSISSSYVGQTSLTTLGTVATGAWQGTKVGLGFGGTNADLSGTGGTSQVLKQVTSGGAVTVAQLAFADVSGTLGLGAGGTGQVTANAALNALLPTQTSNSGKYLTTDGTNSSWGTVSGGGTGANPTASVGLTAVNGSATTFLRSDGAPVLSQAIAPTWTALHTFGPSVTASSGIMLGTVISPTFVGSSTAGYTALKVNTTETSIGSGSNLLLDLQVGGTSKANIDRAGNGLFGQNATLSTATPVHVSFGGSYGSNTPGTVGNLKWYLYNDGTSANSYGIGMSAGIMEFQTGAGSTGFVFFPQNSEVLRVASSTVTVTGTLAVNAGGGLVSAPFYADTTNTIAYFQAGVDTTHAWGLFNRTATKVPLSIQGATSQSANLLNICTGTTGSLGTTVASFDSTGNLTIANASPGVFLNCTSHKSYLLFSDTNNNFGLFDSTSSRTPLSLIGLTYNLQVVSGAQFAFSSNADFSSVSADTGLARDAAGVVRVTDGSTGIKAIAASSYLKRPITLTAGTTVATDTSLGSIFTLTPAQNFTLSNPTNLVSGRNWIYRISQPASGGPWTLAFGTNFNVLPNLGTLVLTAVASAVNYVTCIYNEATTKVDVVAFV